MNLRKYKGIMEIVAAVVGIALVYMNKAHGFAQLPVDLKNLHQTFLSKLKTDYMTLVYAVVAFAAIPVTSKYVPTKLRTIYKLVLIVIGFYFIAKFIDPPENTYTPSRGMWADSTTSRNVNVNTPVSGIIRNIYGG